MQVLVDVLKGNLTRPSIDNFQEMQMKNDLVKGLAASGLEKPLGIQKEALLPCLNGEDVIVHAPSKMGKTVALVIAALEHIDLEDESCQGIILTSTRELAIQVCTQSIKTFN